MAKFSAVSAPKLPKLACVGEVTEVSDTKVSQKGTYNVTNIKVEPRGGGFKTQFSLLTRPEWLAPGFKPDVELDGQSGPLFVYKTNIQGPPGGGVSRLIGLAGSEEKSESLVDDIFSAATDIPAEDGSYLGVPSTALDSAIRKHAGVVGYVLTQKMEDTGEVDEEGKKIRIRTQNYELDQLFFPTPEALKKYRRLAAERPEDWRVGFDEAF